MKSRDRICRRLLHSRCEQRQRGQQFTATCTSSNGRTTQVASKAASPITVAMLTTGKTYSCTVTAANAPRRRARVQAVASGDGRVACPSDGGECSARRVGTPGGGGVSAGSFDLSSVG
ncbi:MAG: hypothetical protein JWR83_2250 [Aeromicrobium sp.]|jgi:hypothetical protein|nr:hypothetical protein [Aeromicrobium sp.]MDQ1385321.1 hypothetical protein [Actinomycetota bacterium]